MVVSAIAFRSLLDICVTARAPAVADLLAAVGDAVADASCFIAARAHERDVVDADGRFLLDHATGRHLGAARSLDRARLRMALDHVDLLDDQPAILGQHLEHLAAASDVLAGQHLDLVAAPDLETGLGLLLGLRLGHHSTSGASETIFMKLRSRSSRATGPKMRVPRGLRAASMITAALSSKAMYVPSSRAKDFLVRTTTAVTTSPFLTEPFGVACLTAPTMMSPTRA